MDYTGSDTQNALREMFVENFAEEGLETLTQSLETQATEKLAKGQESPDAMEIPDVILAKEMFNRLVETASLPETDLTALALSKAEAARALVIESGSLPPERLGVKEPVSLPSGDEIAATLSLEAMK